MRRGVSPVITSALLVLVSISTVAIFYTWATSAVGTVSSAIFEDAQLTEKRILSSVQFILPPPENPAEVNQPVIIHNNGAVTLSTVQITVVIPGKVAPYQPTGIVIRTDGNIESVNFATESVDELYPGDAIVAWLPDVNNYYGYTVVLTATNYEKAETIGVAK